MICFDYIARKVSRCLRSALGAESCSYWFAFDIAGEPGPQIRGERNYLISASQGRLHLHGVMDCPGEKEKTVREALHHVNSDRYAPRFKKFAVRFDRYCSALGWAEYACKDRAPIRLMFHDHQVLRIDNRTRRTAERLYNEFRATGKLTAGA